VSSIDPSSGIFVLRSSSVAAEEEGEGLVSGGGEEADPERIRFVIFEAKAFHFMNCRLSHTTLPTDHFPIPHIDPTHNSSTVGYV
jgi:hypothetical protein